MLGMGSQPKIPGKVAGQLRRYFLGTPKVTPCAFI
jgi:hypothetical protein